METRKFTVVDTRSNQKKTFDSNATTFGELKTQLRSMGIDTDDIAVEEGLTHTEFTSDSSILPSNVPYRGGVTNNLLFRITKAQNKIKSGLSDRQQVLVNVKNAGLVDNIRFKYGKSYTNLPTAVLEKELAEAKNDAMNSNNEENYNVVAAIEALTDLLVEKGYIIPAEAMNVYGALHTEKENDCLYTDEEIASIFNPDLD